MRIDEITNKNLVENSVMKFFTKLFPNKNPSGDPENLTPEQREVIEKYTLSGYSHINQFLRSKYNTPTDPSYSGANVSYDPYEIENKVNLISSAFTKENTNNKVITIYTGISTKQASDIWENKDSVNNFRTFVSCSSDYSMALNFATLHANNDKFISVLTCVCPPNTVLDIKSISLQPQEDELLINHGQQFKVLSKSQDTTYYPGTTINNIKIQLLAN
jgi:hypothetical protein